MNKTAIKNFAIWARNKLIADVSYDARLIGITEDGIAKPLPQSFGGTQFFDIGTAEPYSISGEAVRQRDKLIEVIQQKEKDTDYKTAYQYVIEEVAYTWFNRLIAIRFMEVNDYLPSHIRVLSSESGKLEPDLVTTPFDAELPFTAEEEAQIFQLKQDNKLDEVFRILFLKQCNALNEILPALFEKTKNYTELLLSLSVIDQDGVVYHLIHDIPEDDFNIERGGQVEIIGWLYQYYNTEPKAAAFAKNGKITKEEIPAVTQLFTPDWIVRYMVENSLGRLWYEGHPTFDKSDWKYYLDEAPQEPQVEQQLKDIRAQYAKMEPEQLKVIDPCMGSGHILCYLFDVLMQIYLDNGYSKREAVRSILENNLFGLDIDKRAAQIAYFSVMMKAREYDSNFFSRSNIPQPRVYDIQESNWLGGAYKHEMGNFLNSQEHRDTLNYLLDVFVDAKEYGSILQIKPLDYEGLKEAWETSAAATAHDANMAMWYDAAKDTVAQLIEQAIMLSQKYDAVVTNPPYMGGSGMNARLVEFIKKNYPDSKSDLFSVMMERSDALAKQDGFTSLITMESWMFLSSFEKLRDKINDLKTIVNMVHMPYLGKGGTSLGINFGTAAVVMKKGHIADYSAQYEYTVYYECDDDGVPLVFPTKNERWKTAKQEDFAKIPGSPVAYWVSDTIISLFTNNQLLESRYETKLGMSTNDNGRFLRHWYEISICKACFHRKNNDLSEFDQKWFPYNKGGAYRKWYGNLEYVINWEENGAEVKELAAKLYGSFSRTCKNTQHFFRKALTWNLITTGNFSCRYLPEGCVLGDAGPVCFAGEDDKTILAYLNSTVIGYILPIINPTINCSTGVISSLPVLSSEEIQKSKNRVLPLCDKNIELSKCDWDAFETSWDFKKHPLV